MEVVDALSLGQEILGNPRLLDQWGAGDLGIQGVPFQVEGGHSTYLGEAFLWTGQA